MSSPLTEEVRGFVGREVTYTAPEEIGRASIRCFALALGDERLYTDDDYARSLGYAGAIAPPTFVCETNQYMSRSPSEDGYIGHLWELPIEGRLIRGGNEYEFFRPLYPSDRLTVSWKIADIVERNSSSGEPLIFVISEVTYTNQDGDRIARNRETNIYQRKE
jgi:acyl dehydratase